MADDSFTNGEPPPTGRTLRIVGGIDEMRDEIQAVKLLVKGAKWTKIMLGALSGAFAAGVMIVGYYYNLETKSHAQETVTRVEALEKHESAHNQALDDMREMLRDVRDDIKRLLRPVH